MTDHSPDRVARLLLLAGYVQGRGIRPAIIRLARRLELCGFVCNTTEGVRVQVEGDSERVHDFEVLLPNVLPRDVNAYVVSSDNVPFTSADRFDIATLEIESSCEPPSVLIPTDRAACTDCLSELATISDRRFGYALSSCTNCGPRYTIVATIPFERANTAMAEFELCEDCRREYESEGDRRLHAQTIACEHCGPQIRLEKTGFEKSLIGTLAIQAAAEILLNHGILCIKGIGGFQLLGSATSNDAVARLRKLKCRAAKPFAVMACSDWICWEHITPLERSALRSPSNPVVIVNSEAISDVVPSVSCGLPTVGLFLPSSPLHELLLRAGGNPLVVTSANTDSDPIEFEDPVPSPSIRDSVDAVLTHNRPILRPIDDSVVRIMNEASVTLRLGRGLAPTPLAIDVPHRILAVGGHQKVAVALSSGRQSILGPHIGDMNSLASRQRFVSQTEALMKLYRMQPEVIMHDMHPDYFTTQWAGEQRCRTIAVQHHHAHVVSAMLAHRWTDREVLGVAFDGTGYGPDGTIWGGEFLLATVTGFRRIAHLRTFALPGTDVAVREPWRIALALVADAMPELSTTDIARLIESRRSRTQPEVSLEKLQVIHRLKRSRLSVHTSSMGRLFDGVASLVLGITKADFEGEPAIRLEALAARTSSFDPRNVAGYTIAVEDSANAGSAVIDWRPMIRELVMELTAGVHASEIAIRFHRTISNACALVVTRFPKHPVVLSGGCFQNRLLTECTTDVLSDVGRLVGTPGLIPPNDGGLAVGQLLIGSAVASTSRSE